MTNDNKGFSPAGFESYLTEEDIRIIASIENLNLEQQRKDEIIKDVKATAWQQYQALSIIKPKEMFSIESFRTERKLPDGWEETKARVKAQLEENRLYAPIEGTNNQPFYAAEQREAAEAKRVAEWKQRKLLEIEARKQARLEREISHYHAQATPSDRNAALESLSPEALQRIVSKGA